MTVEGFRGFLTLRNYQPVACIQLSLNRKDVLLHAQVVEEDEQIDRWSWWNKLGGKKRLAWGQSELAERASTFLNTVEVLPRKPELVSAGA